MCPLRGACCAAFGVRGCEVTAATETRARGVRDAPRRDFLRCETAHCRTILGEWLRAPARLLTSFPATVPLDGTSPIVIVCPHCGSHRLVERR